MNVIERMLDDEVKKVSIGNCCSENKAVALILDAIDFNERCRIVSFCLNYPPVMAWASVSFLNAACYKTGFKINKDQSLFITPMLEEYRRRSLGLL